MWLAPIRNIVSLAWVMMNSSFRLLMGRLSLFLSHIEQYYHPLPQHRDFFVLKLIQVHVMSLSKPWRIHRYLGTVVVVTIKPSTKAQMGG